MVADEIAAAGVKNARVLESMKITPRHEFVSALQRKYAYFDMALPIGEQQTISPPFVVAYMTEQIDPQPGDKVLEIGTGSGYQAAVLSPLVSEVYSIEIVPELGRKAERTLRRLKYKNVFTKVGDGYKGWPEHAPFDKIIVTCSPERVPTALVDQLSEGGLMIVPVGERYQQNLYLFEKTDGALKAKELRATLFVPMTGAAESKRRLKPDPLNPVIYNGSFEELVDEGELPDGWHYLRQATLVTDEKEARQGKRYLTFTNDDPGRGCRALQGFAVDGRQVTQLDLSLWVKGKNLRYGQDRSQWPRLQITYYDEGRAICGQTGMGPWVGSLDWQRHSKQLPVPLKAREAIIHVGLLGGIGELSIDDVEMKAVKK
jgi:protein-L-isoaspartate(D-aspartate) O-methyltransferase